jgi:ribosomal protein S18 acetylase RimI-like enzyme
MLSGCINCFWKSLLLLWIYWCAPVIWIATREHNLRLSHNSPRGFNLYADALIPVNNDGLGDYIRNAISSSIFQPWLRQQRQSPQPTDMATVTSTRIVIRIQRTDESQLSDIASFLATASQHACIQERQASNPWKSKIDLLFAKSDIEALIRRRWRILDNGRKAFVRAEQQIELQEQQTMIDVKQQHRLATFKDRKQGDDAIVKYLWSTNDELRTEIQLAASETGEDTIWKHHHPMVITPSSTHWFNHIQMSAIASSNTQSSATETYTEKVASVFNFPFSFMDEVDETSLRKVVGFCEVAMLLNPIYTLNQTIDDCNCLSKTDCVISIPNRVQQRMDNTPQINYYSPAIANLAVDNTMRRQGIATKLLQRAERYISRYWTNTTTIGLYVSASNIPAIRLYEKCGYHKLITVPSTSSRNGNDESGRNPESDGIMWYMSKQIRIK